MKQVIIIEKLNEAIVFKGKYLQRDLFDYITSNIPKVNRIEWLERILQENGYTIVELCHNASLFSCSEAIII